MSIMFSLSASLGKCVQISWCLFAVVPVRGISGSSYNHSQVFCNQCGGAWQWRLRSIGTSSTRTVCQHVQRWQVADRSCDSQWGMMMHTNVGCTSTDFQSVDCCRQHPFMPYNHSYNRKQAIQPDMSLSLNACRRVLVSAQAPCHVILLWMAVHAWTWVYTHVDRHSMDTQSKGMQAALTGL